MRSIRAAMASGSARFHAPWYAHLPVSLDLAVEGTH